MAELLIAVAVLALACAVRDAGVRVSEAIKPRRPEGVQAAPAPYLPTGLMPTRAELVAGMFHIAYFGDRGDMKALRKRIADVLDALLGPESSADGVKVAFQPVPFNDWPKLARDAYEALEKHLEIGPSYPLALLVQLRVGIAGRAVDANGVKEVDRG